VIVGVDFEAVKSRKTQKYGVRRRPDALQVLAYTPFNLQPEARAGSWRGRPGLWLRFNKELTVIAPAGMLLAILRSDATVADSRGDS
jgi:hypothetical protein